MNTGPAWTSQSLLEYTLESGERQLLDISYKLKVVTRTRPEEDKEDKEEETAAAPGTPKKLRQVPLCLLLASRALVRCVVRVVFTSHA